ncbi:unnamed protein product [Miscanthus lutarioriparius]|uniref:Cytochrome P450 n=1 Tax=Miscanthus lutarioriparius TaxID=422564 RepID=A0A811SNN5_9POAL|nr:unnamed protein product [Miscanthus lutarioriparius]
MGIVRARRQSASVSVDQSQRDDVLSRFVASAEHSDEALRDIMLSFLIAGRETTSSALTWFFWLLSTSRPAMTARVLAEVRAARASTGTRPGLPLGFDALRGMHYLHAALTESMRLYPPALLDSQSCAADDTLPDGTRVGKGWSVTYSAYAMGWLSAIWGDDCAEFRPERMCLGKEMAYVQMKPVVASVLEEFVVDVRKEVAGGGVPEHVLSVTLRMKGGLPVQVRRREQDGSAE